MLNVILFLDDNELLNDKLNQVYDLLTKLTTNDPNGSSTMKSHKTRTFNNLQVANLLVSNLSKMLNQTNPLNSIVIDDKLNKTNSHKMKSKTINEIIGEQMLEQFDWLKAAFREETSNNNSKPNTEPQSHSSDLINNCENVNFMDSLDKLEKLITRIKLNRLTTLGRLFQAVNTSEHNVLLNVCNKCTGQIKIV